MTREEAIARLKLDRDLCNFNPMTGEKEPMNEDCGKSAEALDMAIKALEREQKTGHWIDYSEEGFVECSECGSATVCDGNINELHFCFSCGAKMDENERILKYTDQDTMMPAT